MSEFKGTPGPWTVDTTITFGTYGVWTDYATHPGHDGAGYGSQICNMFTVSFQQTDKETRLIRDANARLIAAAPDLLAACIALRMEAAARGCGLRIADEAISKALGTPTEGAK